MTDHAANENESGREQPKVVRLRKPRAILLEFNGTIAPIKWEENVIYPYVCNNLLAYLVENQNNQEIWRQIEVLRRLSHNDRYVSEIANAPVIATMDSSGKNTQLVLQTTAEYVLWQLKGSKISPASFELSRLCWKHGYRNQKLKTEIFADVLPAILQWKESGIKVCLFSALEHEFCKLFLSSTTVGDVAVHLDHIFDHQNAGRPYEMESYDKIATALNVDKSELLFMSDYGQDVKFAHQAGLLVLLFNRPQSRKNRAYYLVRFQNTDTMANIEFVSSK